MQWLRKHKLLSHNGPALMRHQEGSPDACVPPRQLHSSWCCAGDSADCRTVVSVAPASSWPPSASLGSISSRRQHCVDPTPPVRLLPCCRCAAAAFTDRDGHIHHIIHWQQLYCQHHRQSGEQLLKPGCACMHNACASIPPITVCMQNCWWACGPCACACACASTP